MGKQKKLTKQEKKRKAELKKKKERRKEQWESRRQELLESMPESVVCNTCQRMLTDIEPLDPETFPGITHLGRAICPDCTDATWTVAGDPEAVVVMKEALTERAMNQFK